MFRFLHDLVFAGRPVRFESRYALMESVRRLEAAMQTPHSRDPLSEGIEGSATVQRVWICRSIPAGQNGLKPIFIGSFGMENGRVFLAGTYALSAGTKWSLAVVFGLLFSVFGVIVAFVIRGEVLPVAALIPVGMMAVIAGFSWLGRKIGEADERWISGLLRRTLER